MTETKIIESKAHGEVTVQEQQLISFPVGLFGFEEIHEYALLDSTRPPLHWLQSLNNRDTAFIVVNPYVVVPDYVLDIDPEDVQEIGSPAPEDLIVFCIVTISEADRRVTCNLQGPLIINRAARLGRQAISLDSRWGIRHSLLSDRG
jgi:flagellar assembly factor FliW